MSFIKNALEALPAAAQSLYGLIAYAIAIGSWLIIAYRVQRNKNLLNNITALPEKDRLAVLEIEMGGIRLTGGATPEQWLKYRTKKYLITGYALTLLAIIIILLIASFWKPLNPEISLTLLPEGKAMNDSLKQDQEPVPVLPVTDTVRNSDNNNISKNQTAADPPLHEVRNVNIRRGSPLNPFTRKGSKDIYYSYDKDDDLLKVYPVFKYKEQIDAGEFVDGLSYTWEPFSWEFPVLSYKVANTTAKTILISEIVINVKRSEINLSPLLFVDDVTYYGKLHIYNDGWGNVEDPSLSLCFFDADEQEHHFDPKLARKIPLSTFEDRASININDYLDDKIKNKLLECTDEIMAIGVGGMSMYSSESDELKCLDSIPGEYCKNIKGKVSDAFLQGLLAEVNQFNSGTKYTLDDIFYKRRCRSLPVVVHGVLNYTDKMDKSAKVFKFRTLVYLREPGVGAPKPPSYEYDLFLEAGRSKYSIRLPVSQEIQPGATDHFIINVASNKSSNYNLVLSVLDAKGSTINKNQLDLRLIVPKSGFRYAALKKQKVNI